jgi:rod shape-determining protein MreD
MRTVALTVALSLLVLLLHTAVVKFLAIEGIAPDILLLWITYIAIRRGQIAGTTAGFFLGLMVDLLSGSDGMLGLAALSKTVAGFIAGYFYNETKTSQTLGGNQYIVVIVIVSLVHNAIYFLIFLQGTGINWMDALLRYGIPATLYTAAAALIPMFVYARKHLS